MNDPGSLRFNPNERDTENSCCNKNLTFLLLKILYVFPIFFFFLTKLLYEIFSGKYHICNFVARDIFLETSSIKCGVKSDPLFFSSPRIGREIRSKEEPR